MDIIVGQYYGAGVNIAINHIRDPSCMNASITAGCSYGWTCVNESQICTQCKEGLNLNNGICTPCPALENCLNTECSTYDVRCILCSKHYVISPEGHCTVDIFDGGDYTVIAPGGDFTFALPADFDQ